MMWGKYKENGIWFVKRPQYKLLIGDGRLIYLAFNRFRFRLV